MGCKKKTRSVISEFMGPEFYSVYRAYYYIKKKKQRREKIEPQAHHTLSALFLHPPQPSSCVSLHCLTTLSCSLHRFSLPVQLHAPPAMARSGMNEHRNRSLSSSLLTLWSYGGEKLYIYIYGHSKIML